MRSTRSIDVQGVDHFALSVKVVRQYQRGVLFRLGKVVGVKEPGLALIIPVIDRLVRLSVRIVTMPIQSQGIITRDNVSVDISAVAYFRVVDPLKSVIAHRETSTPRSTKIAQTTLRKVVGQHTLDEALSETNASIQKILDVATLEGGVEVNLVELKDNQLPDSMKRAIARQAEAEREKRTKFIAAEGESMAAGRPWGCVGHDDGAPLALATGELADAGRARCGEERHGDVPVTDDECDRPDQQLPHPGNRRRARDHTPAGNSQTIGTTGASHNQWRAGERRGCGTGARGRLTARRMDID